MKTYTNTKNITAKIFYDLLKSNFKEMFPKETLGYGINQNLIAIEDKGKSIYEIEVTDELFTLLPIDPAEKKIGKKLEQFIEASLLPADEL
ncbi:hypothetical protein SAMN06265348_109110 [Pedobacter westerhofensis]|uniref:Uncharacterized protein n=1 Tax=Pedobacter westerhofensis TaxID=425512 RepID=A0A521ET24_9SPHI|nr:hypothetical protein [Pedobacter westerhofensis]SMO87108.1 hypothetical protein SAMN06265348_109110 [Pedobacter westerhofensis]